MSPQLITHTHDATLMLGAIIVSVVASFTGLALTRNIVGLPENMRKTRVSMSAIVIGGGIWTMHFVAMLANRFSVPVSYDVLLTLSSGLVSILVVGLALLLLHYTARSVTILNIAGLLLGAGIVSMHYIGMSAMLGAIPQFGISSVLLALAAAATMGVAAVRIAYGRRSRENILLGGLLLGLSVVVVHYSAMSGTGYFQAPGSLPVRSTIDNASLAIVLVCAVFVLCGAFLLVATTFLTTPGQQGHLQDQTPSDRTLQAVIPLTSTESVSSSAITTATGYNDDDDSGHEVIDLPAPVADTVASQQMEKLLQGNAREHSMDTSDELGSETIRIPFERNKKIQFVSSRDVAAIRADGRYTQLYTPDGSRLCPWSISEAEHRLTTLGFFRSHRSYLVNVHLLAAFEKRKDSGVCLFEGYSQLGSVPVSRTRVSELMTVLNL